MKVSPQYVIDHYDDVAEAVGKGEIVEMALPEKPVLRLVPALAHADEQTGERVLGAGSADVHLLLDNWDEIDREWRKSFEEKFGSDEV
jgi:antitoxin (DNA-binding transcriptional repressor) of toxin-antitoxin stability system